MRLGLLCLGLMSSACVAFGYDFDEYRPAEPGASGGSESAGAPGVEAGAGAAGAGVVTTACEPSPDACFEAATRCGPIDDGCGQPLDCGACFWWFETCVDGTCVVL